MFLGVLRKVLNPLLSSLRSHRENLSVAQRSHPVNKRPTGTEERNGEGGKDHAQTALLVHLLIGFLHHNMKRREECLWREEIPHGPPGNCFSHSLRRKKNPKIWNKPNDDPFLQTSSPRLKMKFERERESGLKLVQG